MNVTAVGLLFANLCAPISLGSASAPAVSQADACASKLPGSLLTLLRDDFPDYRLVRESDYSSEDVAVERQYHGGDACLGIAAGDFDGDEVTDHAFLLISNQKQVILVVARIGVRETWTLDTLWRLTPESHVRTYVNTLAAG